VKEISEELQAVVNHVEKCATCTKANKRVNDFCLEGRALFAEYAEKNPPSRVEYATCTDEQYGRLVAENKRAARSGENNYFEMKIDLSRIVLKVCIPGEPQAWERAGRNGSRSFDTPANKAAKLTIRQYIMLANPRLKPDCQNRFGKIFLFATHKWNTDEDNYAKLVNDAVKGLVWKDDRQADESYVRVARGPNVIPQTQLIFYTLPLDLGGI